MKFKLIIVTVKPHKTDPVVDAAKAAGATGATIISGRGTGMREAKTFFGLTLEDQTDVILFILEEHLVKKVMEAIKVGGDFHEPGTGIAFALSVDNIIGLESQMEKFKEQIRDQYF